ncbi:MAG: UxaA family hydrolase [Fusobacteriaceae bacterium]|jgi:altronate dehydratase small subunit|nr:UxaA family hydrolase [Fusobacteriaceae bacterium]
MINALIIDVKDNVAIAIEQITKGTDINYKLNNKVLSLKALSDIQIYHKFATKDIIKGNPIVKYGEHIGIAAKNIKAGEHVHIHNVESHRENL